jgi:SOS response regulatory protein OraA/RecX
MVMMKILSRIEGNEKKCESVIKRLLKKVSRKLPQSGKKLEQMLTLLNNNGYTSFWN